MDADVSKAVLSSIVYSCANLTRQGCQGYKFANPNPRFQLHHSQRNSPLKNLISALTISSFALFGSAAYAQHSEYGEPISTELAKQAAAAALDVVEENGWQMAVTVIDPSGNLVYFEKVDGTQHASVGISMAKAQAAAGFRRPTSVWVDVIANTPSIITLPGVVGSPGGVPIVVDGKVIGAIGCSGATGEQDGIACTAGAAAID